MSFSFAVAAAWGLLVLTAFIGWGSAIAALLFRGSSVDAGLRASWGMAFAIFVGSLACLLTIASSGLVFTFVVAGIGLAGLHCVRSWKGRSVDVAAVRARWMTYPGSSLVLLLCVGTAFVQYVGSICNMQFNPNDDFIAYFPFAKQILQQGTLFDPFSTRRVMSFGGQSFLHALVLAGVPAFRLHLLDQGICLLLAVMLVIGDRAPNRPVWTILPGLLILITLPDIRANTYSQMSGVVVFYGLYRTLAWLHAEPVQQKRERHPIAAAVVIALLGSAACALRSNYIAVAVPMIALSYAHLVWKARADRRERLRETGLALLLSIAFLTPWMVMSYRSSGTPLFPLLQGHFNQAFPMLQPAASWRLQLSDLMDTVTENRLLRAFPLLLLAGFLLPDRNRKPLHTLLLSGIIGWVLLVHTLASDASNFERYVYGFLVASALAVATRSSMSTESAPRIAVRCAQAAVVVAVSLQLILVGPAALAHHEDLAHKITSHASLALRPPELTPEGRRYRALQMQVPQGTPLLVMVDFPFLFDFARNDIYNVDTAAAVSPPPGMPYFQGPERVAEYLRGQSIRYLAMVAPERAVSLYRRDVWEHQGAGLHPLWRAQAPVYLDLFDNFAKLAGSRRHLYDDGTLVLLDLGQIRSAATSRPPA